MLRRGIATSCYSSLRLSILKYTLPFYILQCIATPEPFLYFSKTPTSHRAFSSEKFIQLWILTHWNEMGKYLIQWDINFQRVCLQSFEYFQSLPPKGLRKTSPPCSSSKKCLPRMICSRISSEAFNRCRVNQVKSNNVCDLLHQVCSTMSVVRSHLKGVIVDIIETLSDSVSACHL